MSSKNADSAGNAKSANRKDLLFTGGVFGKLPEPLMILCSRIDEPHLYVTIIARPASGKGIISKVKELGTSLQRKLTEVPEEQRSFFIPGNTSSRALYDTLKLNKGAGVIFETEKTIAPTEN